MLGPIAHQCYRKDTVRACKIAVLTMDRHRNGCQCSTTAAPPPSRGPPCTDGAGDIPIAPPDPGAQLLASSFPGGFRTPARSPQRRAQCRAGIRNPSQLRKWRADLSTSRRTPRTPIARPHPQRWGGSVLKVMAVDCYGQYVFVVSCHFCENLVPLMYVQLAKKWGWEVSEAPLHEIQTINAGAIA